MQRLQEHALCGQHTQLSQHCAPALTWMAAVVGTNGAWAMTVVPQTKEMFPANWPVPTPTAMTVAVYVLYSP